MRKYRCLIFFFAFCSNAKAQQTDSVALPFSEWHLRINPLSFVERIGGAHIGIETNVDKHKRYYFISEYGYIFLNNGEYNAEAVANENKSRINGFETKQELRRSLHGKKSASFFGIEVHYIKASGRNAGWFGMGQPDAAGNYPYMKYQHYKEVMTSTSLAFKYISKAFLQTKKWNIEAFTGLGLVYRDIKNENAEGKLIGSDSEPLFKEDSEGIKPYLAIGIRFSVKLK